LRSTAGWIVTDKRVERFWPRWVKRYKTTGQISPSAGGRRSGRIENLTGRFTALAHRRSLHRQGFGC
jgi:hypothetical protein